MEKLSSIVEDVRDRIDDLSNMNLDGIESGHPMILRSVRSHLESAIHDLNQIRELLAMRIN